MNNNNTNNAENSKADKHKQQIEQAKKVQGDKLAKALLIKAFELKKSILVAGLIAISMSTTGCGYAFMGTESIDAWGYKVKFASGATVRAGINNIDQVDDSQGVDTRSPKGQREVQ